MLKKEEILLQVIDFVVACARGVRSLLADYLKIHRESYDAISNFEVARLTSDSHN
jgi:hypothetical protein